MYLQLMQFFELVVFCNVVFLLLFYYLYFLLA